MPPLCGLVQGRVSRRLRPRQGEPWRESKWWWNIRKRWVQWGFFPLMEYPPFMDVRWIYPVIDVVPVSQWWFNSPLPSSIAGGQRLSEKMEKWYTIERSGFVWKLVLSIKGIRWLWLSFPTHPLQHWTQNITNVNAGLINLDCYGGRYYPPKYINIVIDYDWNRASRLKTVAPPVFFSTQPPMPPPFCSRNSQAATLPPRPAKCPASQS